MRCMASEAPHCKHFKRLTRNQCFLFVGALIVNNLIALGLDASDGVQGPESLLIASEIVKQCAPRQRLRRTAEKQCRQTNRQTLTERDHEYFVTSATRGPSSESHWNRQAVSVTYRWRRLGLGLSFP
jgi:hypothetical protein